MKSEKREFWSLVFGLRPARLFFFCVFSVLCVTIGSAQNLETLAENIRSGTTEQKREALFQIRNLQSAEASRLAIPALKDSDEIVRAAAASAVIFLPKDEAFNALSPNLQDQSAFVRTETAYALGKLQNPTAVGPLIQLLQNDKIPEVRTAGAVALGEIGDVSAVSALTQILQQKPSEADDFRRRSAARAIGQIAQIKQIQDSKVVTPESFLPEKYKSLELEKYQNLSEKFPPFRGSVTVLIRVLQNSKESDDTRRETAFALGAIGDPTSKAVLETNLNAKDYYLAEICREALKKINT